MPVPCGRVVPVSWERWWQRCHGWGGGGAMGRVGGVGAMIRGSRVVPVPWEGWCRCRRGCSEQLRLQTGPFHGTAMGRTQLSSSPPSCQHHHPSKATILTIILILTTILNYSPAKPGLGWPLCLAINSLQKQEYTSSITLGVIGSKWKRIRRVQTKCNPRRNHPIPSHPILL